MLLLDKIILISISVRPSFSKCFCKVKNPIKIAIQDTTIYNYLDYSIY